MKQDAKRRGFAEGDGVIPACDKNLEKIKVHNFKRELCRHYQKGYCKLGNICNFAHGEDELRDRTGVSKPYEQFSLFNGTPLFSSPIKLEL